MGLILSSNRAMEESIPKQWTTCKRIGCQIDLTVPVLVIRSNKGEPRAAYCSVDCFETDEVDRIDVAADILDAHTSKQF